MKNKRGISLIVLVITILVMIILAGVVVVTMTQNNPIEKAKIATFKNNIVTYNEDLNVTIANRVSNNITEKINATEIDIKKYIPSMSSKDAKLFNIVNNKLCYVGKSIEEEVLAVECGVVPKGNIAPVYEKIIPEANQIVNGETGQNIIRLDKPLKLQDTFEIIFEAIPGRSTTLDGLTNSNHMLPHNAIIDASIYDGEFAGFGINLGTNGINIVEHRNGYFPYKAIYKADLTTRHTYRIVVHEKNYYIYIDDNLVSKGTSNYRLAVSKTNLFQGHYNGFVGKVFNIKFLSK